MNLLKRLKKTSCRLLAITLSITPFLTPVSSLANSTPFSDVADNQWYTGAVEYVYQRGIMTGNTSTHFGLNETLSRGQLMTILYRLAGEPTVRNSHVFVDVPEGIYFTTPIRWAYENNITTGYTSSTFGPADPVSRQDFVTFLYRYTALNNQLSGTSANLNTYPDAGLVSSYAQNAMRWAVGNGIISGDNGYLNPTGLSSRAVSAMIIARYLAPGSFQTPGSNTGNGSGSGNTSQNTSIVQASTAKVLATAWSNLKKSGSANARLIVRAKGAVDFASTSPKAVVQGPDNFYIVQYENNSQAQSALNIVKTYSQVNNAFIEPDTTSFNHLSYGPDLIQSDAYKNRISSKVPVVIAVIDTGAELMHPLLQNKLLGGYDFAESDNEPQDSDGHGSHVSGIIADVTQGLDVYILPIQIFSANNPFSTDSDVAKGVEYAIQQGANIINLSIGIKGHSEVVDQAVQKALDAGITVVAAAGNDGINVNSYCPAHYSNLITVGAVDSGKKIGWYSNYGNAIDLVAPGSAIVSTYTNLSTKQLTGTSMAAPFISSAAAMILTQNPNLNGPQIEEILKSATDDLGDPGWDSYYGNGLINFAKLNTY